MTRASYAGPAQVTRPTADRDGSRDGRRQAGGAGSPASGPEEGQQVGVELILARVGQAVRAARVDLHGRVLHECRRSVSRGSDRQDLVVVAVDDERGDVELLEVLREVRLGRLFDADRARSSDRPACPATRTHQSPGRQDWRPTWASAASPRPPARPWRPAWCHVARCGGRSLRRRRSGRRSPEKTIGL